MHRMPECAAVPPWVKSRSFRRALVAGVLPLLLFCSIRGARAAETPDEALIREGIEHRKKSEDAAALDLFRKAYEMKNTPRAAAQMGLAEMALGRWVDAEAHLGEALVATNDPWVRKNRATLQSALDATGLQLGSLEVLGKPEGAEIVIERRVQGTLPLLKPIRVRAGEIRVEIRSAGYEPAIRTVQVAAHQLTRETVELLPSLPTAGAGDKAGGTVPVAPPSGTSATTVAAAGGPSASSSKDAVPARAGDATTLVERDQPRDRKRARTLRVVGIALAGAGVVSLTAGVIFGYKAKSAGDANSATGGMFSEARENDGRRYQTLQFVGYAVGGTLLAGGVVAWLLGNPRTADGGPAVSLNVFPGGAMAGWRGSF